MSYLAKHSIWVLLVCVTLAFTVNAADIYVDDTAPGADDGSSWQNAYHFLQDALQNAQPGDTVKVAQGTYRPNQASIGAVNTRYATFNLIDGVLSEGTYDLIVGGTNTAA